MMGCVLSAGGSLQWYRNQLGQCEAAVAKTLGQDPYEIITAQAQQRSTRAPGNPNTDAQNLALADFCQAIFALNEFIYVD